MADRLAVIRSQNRKTTRSVMNKTPITRETTRDKSDLTAKSEISDSGTQNIQLENTYRIHPDSDRRFQHKKVEAVMTEVLRENLANVDYDQTLGQRMSKRLADIIRNKVKEFKWLRYKFVVHTVIGENKEQDIRAGSRFLWNKDIDTFVSSVFQNKTVFAYAVCYAVYTE